MSDLTDRIRAKAEALRLSPTNDDVLTTDLESILDLMADLSARLDEVESRIPVQGKASR